MWLPQYEGPIGRTYHLARRDVEATPYLQRAAGACSGLDEPLWPTWASLALGQAEEAQGKDAEACVAYGKVTKRWGAEPTSRSAKLAATRRAALRCPPDQPRINSSAVGTCPG